MEVGVVAMADVDGLGDVGFEGPEAGVVAGTAGNEGEGSAPGAGADDGEHGVGYCGLRVGVGLGGCAGRGAWPSSPGPFSRLSREKGSRRSAHWRETEGEGGDG